MKVNKSALHYLCNFSVNLKLFPKKSVFKDKQTSKQTNKAGVTPTRFEMRNLKPPFQNLQQPKISEECPLVEVVDETVPKKYD